MFFSISKILIFLTDPYFFIILFTFLGALRFKKRALPITIFILIYLISIPFVSQRLMYFLEHLTPPSFNDQSKYDAVIVLSGMVKLSISTADTVEFSGAVERILKGIELLKEKKANYLVISGGSGSLFQTDGSEAVILGEFSKKMGISGQALLLDATSRNTFQNAVNTLEILNKNNLNRVVLITSAFHMYRSHACFKKVGIEADLLPVDFNSTLAISDFRDFVPSSGALHQSYRFLHELVGIIVYGVSGKANYF